MKNKWLYLAGCVVAPHIMFVVGIFFIARIDLERRTFGLRLCKWSTVVLVLGSLAYYIFLTPIVGLD